MIYLYVKTHQITGLKYFGKTTKPDPIKYLGSGIYWKKHLEKYGPLIDTQIIGEYENEDECSKAAIEFSVKHNIVESSDWANLKQENGLDGSPKGVKFSEEHKERIRQSRLGKCYNDFDEETLRKMGEASKIKAQKQLALGIHPFQGEHGKELAIRRSAKLIAEGKHNFQKPGMVSVIDKNGVGHQITKEQFYSQTGPIQEREYVGVRSLEAKQRRNK